MNKKILSDFTSFATLVFYFFLRVVITNNLTTMNCGVCKYKGVRLVLMERDRPAWNCVRCDKYSYVCCFHIQSDWRSESCDFGGGTHCQRCSRYMCIECYAQTSTIEFPDEDKGLHETRIICQGCAKSKREVNLALEKILFNE